MKTLLLRQVRLLATPALVSMALGLVPLLLLSFTSDWRVLTASPAELALALVAIVAPWLIAVAAIAPDAESGGLAFLGGLPLARGRHYALRALVALGWSIVAIAPFLALTAQELSWRPFADFSGGLLMIGALAFVAGLSAGAIARQSLGAFIAAPLLLAVPLGLYEAFVMNLRAPTAFHVAGPIVAGVLLVVAGWLGFRDPANASSWRPLVRTSGLLLGAVVLGCGVTTAAWGHAVVFPERTEDWSTHGRVLLRYSRNVPDWPSADRGYTTTLFQASALERVTTLDEIDGDGWTFDEHLRVLAITPDGHLLAQASYSSQLMLLDLERRQVLARAESTRTLWTYSRGLLRDEPTTLSHDDPWFVTQDRSVRTFSGKVLHQLPVEAQLEATGGSRLVARLAEGKRILLDVDTGVEMPLEVKGDDAYVILSPSGRYLTQWSHMSRANELTVRDLDGERDVSLRFAEGGRPLTHVNMSFAPNERTVLVTWSSLDRTPTDEHDASIETVNNIATLDLESGAVTQLATDTYWFLAWSPSGRRLLSSEGWVDLDDQPDVVRPLPAHDGAIARFIDDDTILWSTDGKIERIELAPTGE